MGRYYTPLRYPGGKQKLSAFISEIIEANDMHDGHYVEPYAGGAGVGVDLLLNGVVSKIHINDLCPGVYAFWKSVVNDTDALCKRIRSASLTIKEWRKQREIYLRPWNHNQLDYGFSFFYLNRCNRSGILTGGVIGGLAQKGQWKIGARFPRTNLIKRIEAIALRKDGMNIKNMDAEEYLKTYVKKLPKNTLVYLDPPYFRKADRLYKNFYKNDDHKRLSNLIQKNISRPWLVSYDNSPEIAKFYRQRRTLAYDLQYNAARAYKGKELLVFSDKIEIPEKSTIRSIDKSLRRL